VIECRECQTFGELRTFGTALESAEAGFKLASLIDPRKGTARIASTFERSILVRANQALDGDDVVSQAFACR
jgi:hypothetical protein